MKINNFKLYKRGISLLLSGVTVLSLAGCNSTNKKESISVDIHPCSTIEGTLDCISENSQLDEILSVIKHDSIETGEETSWQELLDEYAVYRLAEDAAGCNSVLYKMGRLLLQASIMENLNLNHENISSFEIVADDNKEGVEYANIVYYDENDKTHYHKLISLSDEASDLLFNLNRACVGGWDFIPSYDNHTIDDVYDSYIEFLLTSGNLKKKIFDNSYEYSASLNKEKVELYNDYAKKLTLSKFE